jgi:hypothetical protein
MQQIVHQLGELFLQAVPTVVIVLIFYGIMRTLFFVPLMKVMDERETRTVGARKAAETAQTAAANKVKQYQEALKQARAKVYAEQEDARKKLLNAWRANSKPRSRTSSPASRSSPRKSRSALSRFHRPGLPAQSERFHDGSSSFTDRQRSICHVVRRS